MSRGAIIAVAVAAFAAGCGQSGAADKDGFEKKVKEKLPEGYTSLDARSPSRSGDYYIYVSYSYPGIDVQFQAGGGPKMYPQEPNGVYLLVRDLNRAETLARFEYGPDGKLKTKKAEKVSEAAWPWVQETAAKVAAAAFAAR